MFGKDKLFTCHERCFELYVKIFLGLVAFIAILSLGFFMGRTSLWLTLKHDRNTYDYRMMQGYRMMQQYPYQQNAQVPGYYQAPCMYR
jgi:hypothetical protein